MDFFQEANRNMLHLHALQSIMVLLGGKCNIILNHVFCDQCTHATHLSSMILIFEEFYILLILGCLSFTIVFYVSLIINIILWGVHLVNWVVPPILCLLGCVTW